MKRLIAWVKQSAEKHPWAWKLGSIPVVFGVVLLVFALLPAPQDTSGPPDGNDAALICRQMVEDRLKAPSTADFSDLRYSGEYPRWTVFGTVDAENSFGAKLRMNWTCVVKLDGGWKLESLTGLN